MSDVTADTTAAPRSSRARIVLLVAILVLLALLVVLVVLFFNLLKPAGLPEDTGDAAPTGLTWVRSMYGFGPSADEQLLSPSSVAIAPDGRIYATDPIRARIMIFNSDGTFDRLLHTGAGGAGTGQFIRPEALDVDENGEVYIADSWANKIIVFDDGGTYVREWPVQQQARGVYVSDGSVYVLDVGKVIVYDTQGKELRSFGTRGRAPGQLDAYQGIAAKDGSIYVADSYNKRLQSFDDSGKLIWAVPESAANTSGPMAEAAPTSDESSSSAVPGHVWDLPQDLVFDGAGRLVVVDAFTFEMAVIEPKNGKAQAVFGEFGTADGQFFYPTSVDYDPARDWFAVADTQNNRVQIVRIPGSGGSPMSAVWRWTSSPYRYLVVPGLLFLIVLALALWARRRVLDAIKPDVGDSGEGEGPLAEES